LLVTCQVRLAAGARLRLVATLADQQQVVSPPLTEGGEVLWSLFDRQALLAVDGQVVWRELQAARWPGPPQLGVLASGAAEVAELTVWRDAYYHTRPVDRWPAGGRTVPASAYFVVGDNVAISDDSRSWLTAEVPERMLVGIPLAPRMSPDWSGGRKTDLDSQAASE